MNHSATTAEKAFVEQRLRSLQLDRSQINLAMGMAFHVVFFVVSYFVYKGGFITVGRPMHAVCAILNVIGFMVAFKGHRPVAVRISLFLAVLTIAGFALSSYINRSIGQPEVVVSLGDMFTLIVIGYILVGSGLRDRTLAAMALFATAVAIPSIVLLLSTPGADFANNSPLLAHPLIVMIGALFSQRLTNERISHLLAEYRQMVMIAPRQIIRRVLLANESLDKIFAPKDRFCVCICSDWRSYQNLTSILKPDEVVAALESYYTMTESVLEAAFPDGNYFSDWIADELFVVAFAGEEQQQEQVVKQAADFAVKLLAAKHARTRSGLPPAGIDIGVAVGVASVGIIGPKHHRKATALGLIPGRSRRLQSIAKELRHAIGPVDRVVFDADAAKSLQDLAGLCAFRMTTTVQVKDVTDSQVFYVDGPGASLESLKRKAA